MATLSFTPAPLSDPLYYLANARLLIQWTLEYHSDLLLTEENRLLSQFLDLSCDAQSLMIRMVMRKGELFRSDNLSYQEISDNETAISELHNCTLIDLSASVSLAELCHLLRKQECLQFSRYQLPDQVISTSLSKTALIELLETTLTLSDAPLTEWWPEAGFGLIRLNHMQLFDRIRLMFFGNLHQDWSEFVLTELGVQRYETVELNKASRAFNSRSEVNQYLQMHNISAGLEAGDELSLLLKHLPETTTTDWLTNRLNKLLFQLGHTAERQREIETALSLYERSDSVQATIRKLRVLEKQPDTDQKQLYDASQSALKRFSQPEYQISFERISQRCARKAGIKHEKTVATALPTVHMRLPKFDELSVEQSVIQALNAQGYLSFHTESQLFNGLFSLLFWPVLFSPVKGAFFHPFQSGPADLLHSDFVHRRKTSIEVTLAQLDNPKYKDQMLEMYQIKQGISCSLIHWPSLLPELIQLALECIPAQHLKAIFQHLLLDLKHHKRGLPDLICFDLNNQNYKLVEVKGPGDRLQDHQRLWIEFLLQQSVDVEVCYVEWE